MLNNKIFLKVLLLLIAVIFVTCKKDHSVLGTGVQPSEDRLDAHTAVNFPVYAHTVKYDSIVSLNTDDKYLGSNNDPQFGKMDVGLYTNINMATTNVDFGASSVLVSAEIILAINDQNVIGDNKAALTFSVFPLDSVLKSSRAYYTSNQRLHKKSQVLAAHSTTFSAYSGKQSITIPIDAAYATAILHNTEALKSNENLQATYKGFYILPSCGSAEGIIYDCEMAHEISGFYLRYKSHSTDTVIKTFKFSFTGSAAARFNTVTFQPLPALQSQLSGDTAAGGDKLYLKGLGATRLKVQIPFLKNYSDTMKAAVSRAEVIFYLDPVFAGVLGVADHIYKTPPKLALLARDSIGRELLTLDQQNGTYISRYDGNYNGDKKAYVFNIPLHAQAIMKGLRKNYGFYLVVADPLFPTILRRDNYFQSVIFSGSNKINRPVLNLSYLRLNND